MSVCKECGGLGPDDDASQVASLQNQLDRALDEIDALRSDLREAERAANTSSECPRCADGESSRW